MAKAKIIFLNNKSSLTIFLLFASTIFLFSCSNKIHQLSSGSKRPSNEIAILTSFDPVRLLKIDKRFGPGNRHFGYSSRWNSKCIVELEPGNHKIVCKTVISSVKKYHQSRGAIFTEFEYDIGEPKELIYEFKAGKIYQILEVSDNFKIIEVKQIPSNRKPYDIENRVY
ncbi:MAG: hypothetical protein K8R74_16470 [Bacteroidales bacterium]|nr:hypothetical protein [Bacteroidales bacterium]